MTKKDYELIAGSIKHTVNFYDPLNAQDKQALAIIVYLVQNMARKLKEENARFDTSKFYQACGIAV